MRIGVLSGLASIAAITALFGTAACSAPTVGSASHKHRDDVADEGKVEGAHAYRLTASSDTKSALGITQWHVITQSKTQSTVLEGSDSKGNVKFASSFQEADNEVRVKSYRGPRGEMRFLVDGAKLKLGNSTISGDAWQEHLRAFASDSASGEAQTEYAFKATSPGADTGTNSNDAIQGMSDLANGIGGDSGTQGPDGQDGDNSDVNGGQPDAQISDEGTFGASGQDDNLDASGGSPDGIGGEAGDGLGGENVEGQQSFGGGGESGDPGGGDVQEFALHTKCKHLSCSRTSKICICTQY